MTGSVLAQFCLGQDVRLQREERGCELPELLQRRRLSSIEIPQRLKIENVSPRIRAVRARPHELIKALARLGVVREPVIPTLRR